jgi:hypothetical protein
MTAGALVASPGIGQAATTFTVTSTANSGPGTLRDAIQQANASPGEDTIVFALPNPSTIALTDSIRILDDVRIEGPGREALTLTNPTSRVLDVDAGSLYIDSLTVNGAGSAIVPPNPLPNSIIVTSPTGNVVLDDMRISNSANHGLNVVSAASVTVTNSDLTNAASVGLQGDGLQARNVTGNVLIEDVVASGNEDNFEITDVTGTVTLRRVTSTAALDEGGDFERLGGLVIESSVFDNNNDQLQIVSVTGPVTIVDTTISGTVIDDGVEITNVSGPVTVERSTISGSGQAGLHVMGSDVTVVNSTLSGNTNSGLVVSTGATAVVRHSTIAGNSLHGINVINGGVVTASHTILTGNTGNAVRVSPGTATVEHSLLPTGSGVAGAGNIETADALLGSLTFNGGPTKTHLPLAGSPAINSGNPGIVSPPAVDQRGSARVVGTIDIGAVEVSATPPPANRGTVSILPTAINVDESVGTVPFQITRTGGSEGDVSVLVATQNLTAAAPGDFVAFSQVVSFASGEAGSKTVQLTIVDDAKVEDDETLKIRLSQPTGGVAIGASEATITILDNDQAVPPPLDPELDAAGRFVALPPNRLFDTRPAEAAPGPKGKLAAGQTIDVQITGVAGVPADATAVVMNVTMTGSEDFGYVTVWATGAPQPLTSNLNYRLANQTRPNLVTVPIGAGGKVSMFAYSPTHLLADVAGYYIDVDEAVTGGRLVSVPPARVFDTRPSEPAAGPKGLVTAGSTIDVQIAGEGGLPSSGISAVVMNLTATGTTVDGYITAYPTDVAQPTASVLNMAAQGPAVANLVVLPLGPDGKVRLFSFGTTHLLADVMGYFTDTTAAKTTDGLFVPLAPARVFDTRETEAAPGPKGFVAADSSVNFVATAGGVPADAAAVFLNVTATRSGAFNYITGWPTGLPRPLASLLNLGADDTRPNATILAPGSGNQVSLYTFSGAHLLADAFGYYLG